MKHLFDTLENILGSVGSEQEEGYTSAKLMSEASGPPDGRRPGHGMSVVRRLEKILDTSNILNRGKVLG